MSIIDILLIRMVTSQVLFYKIIFHLDCVWCWYRTSSQFFYFWEKNLSLIAKYVCFCVYFRAVFSTEFQEKNRPPTNSLEIEINLHTIVRILENTAHFVSYVWRTSHFVKKLFSLDLPSVSKKTKLPFSEKFESIICQNIQFLRKTAIYYG